MTPGFRLLPAWDFWTNSNSTVQSQKCGRQAQVCPYSQASHSLSLTLPERPPTFSQISTGFIERSRRFSDCLQVTTCLHPSVGAGSARSLISNLPFCRFYLYPFKTQSIHYNILLFFSLIVSFTFHFFKNVFSSYNCI